MREVWLRLGPSPAQRGSSDASWVGLGSRRLCSRGRVCSRGIKGLSGCRRRAAGGLPNAAEGCVRVELAPAGDAERSPQHRPLDYYGALGMQCPCAQCPCARPTSRELPFLARASSHFSRFPQLIASSCAAPHAARQPESCPELACHTMISVYHPVVCVYTLAPTTATAVPADAHAVAPRARRRCCPLSGPAVDRIVRARVAASTRSGSVCTEVGLFI